MPTSRPQSVSEIKQRLKQAGFFHGAIDDEVTKEFVEAVATLQRQTGQFADGLFGPATAQALDELLIRQRQE